MPESVDPSKCDPVILIPEDEPSNFDSIVKTKAKCLPIRELEEIRGKAQPTEPSTDTDIKTDNIEEEQNILVESNKCAENNMQPPAKDSIESMTVERSENPEQKDSPAVKNLDHSFSLSCDENLKESFEDQLSSGATEDSPSMLKVGELVSESIENKIVITGPEQTHESLRMEVEEEKSLSEPCDDRLRLQPVEGIFSIELEEDTNSTHSKEKHSDKLIEKSSSIEQVEGLDTKANPPLESNVKSHSVDEPSEERLRSNLTGEMLSKLAEDNSFTDSTERLTGKQVDESLLLEPTKRPTSESKHEPPIELIKDGSSMRLLGENYSIEEEAEQGNKILSNELVNKRQSIKPLEENLSVAVIEGSPSKETGGTISMLQTEGRVTPSEPDNELSAQSTDKPEIVSNSIEPIDSNVSEQADNETSQCSIIVLADDSSPETEEDKSKNDLDHSFAEATDTELAEKEISELKKNSVLSESVISIEDSNSSKHQEATESASLPGQTNGVPDLYTLPGKESFECDGCQKVFSTKRFYLHHFLRVTSEVKYECERCDGNVKFSNVCLLKDHLKAHGTSLSIQRLKLAMPNLFEFSNCFMRNFKNPHKSSNLSMMASYSQKLVECPECFEMVTTLKDHLTEAAVKFVGLTEPWCEECQFFLPTNCSLKIHKRMHTKTKPYVCPECGKHFITWRYFDNHLLRDCLHYYRCLRLRCLFCGEILQCGTGSSHAYLPLFAHIQALHGANFYKCYVCNALFKVVSDVYPHILSSHKEAAGKIDKNELLRNCKYSQCLLCPGTTLVPTRRLYAHAQKHFVDSIHRIYGYYCESCQIFTKDKDRFMKHLRVRHGCKNPYGKVNMTPVAKQDASPNGENLKQNHQSLLKILTKNPKQSRIANTESDEANQSGDQPQPVAAESSPPKPTPPTANTIIHSLPSKRNSLITKCQLCNNFLHDEQIKLHFEHYHKINCTNQAFYSYYINKVERPDNAKIWSLEDVANSDSSKSAEDKDEDPSPSEPPKKKAKLKSGSLDCSLCDFSTTSIDILKNHFPIHRSSCSWQCMECGKCFVTSASLEIHLVLSHQISDPKKYINTKSVHNASEVRPENLKDNQCSVCLLELRDSAALHSHFRKHGLAFLKKINQSSKK